MLDLKFFYIVELNLKHPALSELALVQEFQNQSWLTLTSLPHDNDKECVDKCMKFMKTKAKEINKDGTKVTFAYAENPHLHCDPDDVDSIDTDGFDENSLVTMSLTDLKDEWIIKSAVMVYGVDPGSIPRIDRRFH